MVKNLPAAWERPGFDPWVGKIPWRRKWQLTPVLLPGESHGQRSLAGYRQWGHKESDMIETNAFTVSKGEMFEISDSDLYLKKLEKEEQIKPRAVRRKETIKKENSVKENT